LTFYGSLKVAIFSTNPCANTRRLSHFFAKVRWGVSSNETGLRDPLIQQFPEGPRAD